MSCTIHNMFASTISGTRTMSCVYLLVLKLDNAKYSVVIPIEVISAGNRLLFVAVYIYRQKEEVLSKHII